MLAITICATKNYTYATRSQAQRVIANLSACPQAPTGVVLLVGDTSKELKELGVFYNTILPQGWSCCVSAHREFLEDGENYKEPAQLLIARMRGVAFALARHNGATHCWSLDSDVLPPANALRCSFDSLAFDAGYYSVASCPYPNTAFLGGCGTYQNPIAEDFLPHERKLPPEIKAEWDANEAEGKKFFDAKEKPPVEVLQRWDVTNKKIKECPPDGTIWEVIAKHGWRRRGWLDHAYPAVGLGAMVPSDWCGFGCTLLNREALSLASFDGYDGKGTEDLYICWRRWHPAGLRINAIPHCPCDHVIWEKKKNGDASVYTHHLAFHETLGEYRGHLRVRQQPWRELA